MKIWRPMPVPLMRYWRNRYVQHRNSIIGYTGGLRPAPPARLASTAKNPGVSNGNSEKARDVNTLVWYEVHATMESAIRREKATKNWKLAWKIKVIEEINPQWQDLYYDVL